MCTLQFSTKYPILELSNPYFDTKWQNSCISLAKVHAYLARNPQNFTRKCIICGYIYIYMPIVNLKKSNVRCYYKIFTHIHFVYCLYDIFFRWHLIYISQSTLCAFLFYYLFCFLHIFHVPLCLLFYILNFTSFIASRYIFFISNPCCFSCSLYSAFFMVKSGMHASIQSLWSFF